ncbi:MAG: hypothetical protein H7301_04080 [Cryobacterium sp.]|nr:hypothetical protein [Oligoflexia bacterium]
MSKWILVASLFSATVAQACPDLSGEYSQCRSQTGEAEVSRESISQRSQDGTEVYSVSSDNLEPMEYVADGETYSVDAPDSNLTYDTTATCEDDALEVDIVARLAGFKVGSGHVTTRKNGNQLTQEIHFSSPAKSVDDTVTCE